MGDITDLLKRVRQHDRAALDELVTLMYPDLHRMAPIRCLLDNDRSYGSRERTHETGRAPSRPRPVAGIPTSRQPGCATTHRARRRRHGPLLGVLPRRAGRPCEVAVPAGVGSAASRGTPRPMTARSPPSDARLSITLSLSAAAISASSSHRCTAASAPR